MTLEDIRRVVGWVLKIQPLFRRTEAGLLIIV